MRDSRRLVWGFPVAGALLGLSCAAQEPREAEDAGPTVASSAAGASAMNFAYTLGSQQEYPLPEPWRAEFALTLWAPGISGDAGVRGLTAQIDADFVDVIEKSDSALAFTGRLEFGKGRWGGFIEGVYANLGAEDQSGPLGITDVDVSFEQFVLDFGAMYRVADWKPLGREVTDARRNTVDLYAGGRATYVDAELSPALLPARDRDETWIDPIIGARFVAPFGRAWRLSLSADVGGFGLESDFTWAASGAIGYDFELTGCQLTVYGGYRAIGWDFSEGSGADEFTWDVIEHGPFLGVTLWY